MPELATAPRSFSSDVIFHPGRPNEEFTADVYESMSLDLAAAFGQSAFYTIKARLQDARSSLASTAALTQGWVLDDAEPPTEQARTLAHIVLDRLETSYLPPSRLMPSVEGGIGISFVEADKRAYIEVYNSGEIAAATYATDEIPKVWEVEDTERSLLAAIDRIRVHLTA